MNTTCHAMARTTMALLIVVLAVLSITGAEADEPRRRLVRLPWSDEPVSEYDVLRLTGLPLSRLAPLFDVDDDTVDKLEPHVRQHRRKTLAELARIVGEPASTRLKNYLQYGDRLGPQVGMLSLPKATQDRIAAIFDTYRQRLLDPETEPAQLVELRRDMTVAIYDALPPEAAKELARIQAFDPRTPLLPDDKAEPRRGMVRGRLKVVDPQARILTVDVTPFATAIGLRRHGVLFDKGRPTKAEAMPGQGNALCLALAGVNVAIARYEGARPYALRAVVKAVEDDVLVIEDPVPMRVHIDENSVALSPDKQLDRVAPPPGTSVVLLVQGRPDEAKALVVAPVDDRGAGWSIRHLVLSNKPRRLPTGQVNITIDQPPAHEFRVHVPEDALLRIRAARKARDVDLPTLAGFVRDNPEHQVTINYHPPKQDDALPRLDNLFMFTGR